MSMGFAGLGKHLAERTLGLLRDKPVHQVGENREDLRLNASNLTNYEQLLEWQHLKRKRSAKLRRIIFASVLLVILTLTVIFFMAI